MMTQFISQVNIAGQENYGISNTIMLEISQFTTKTVIYAFASLSIEVLKKTFLGSCRPIRKTSSDQWEVIQNLQ